MSGFWSKVSQIHRYRHFNIYIYGQITVRDFLIGDRTVVKRFCLPPPARGINIFHKISSLRDDTRLKGLNFDVRRWSMTTKTVETLQMSQKLKLDQSASCFAETERKRHSLCRRWRLTFRPSHLCDVMPFAWRNEHRTIPSKSLMLLSCTAARSRLPFVGLSSSRVYVRQPDGQRTLTVTIRRLLSNSSVTFARDRRRYTDSQKCSTRCTAGDKNTFHHCIVCARWRRQTAPPAHTLSASRFRSLFLSRHAAIITPVEATRELWASLDMVLNLFWLVWHMVMRWLRPCGALYSLEKSMAVERRRIPSTPVRQPTGNWRECKLLSLVTSWPHGETNCQQNYSAWTRNNFQLRIDSSQWLWLRLSSSFRGGNSKGRSVKQSVHCQWLNIFWANFECILLITICF